MFVRYQRYYKTNVFIQQWEREDWKAQIKLLTNIQLLTDYSEMLMGDGMKSEFTPRGLEILKLLQQELESRLQFCGFLTTVISYGTETC